MEDYGTLLYPEDMHKYSNPSASAWFRSIRFLHSSNGGQLSEDFLKENLQTLWVDGIIVLDTEGKMDCEYSTDESLANEITEYLQKDIIMDFDGYEERTYSERFDREDGSHVDIAACARKDAPGIVAIYYYTSPEFARNYTLTIQGLLNGYSTQKDGTVLVADDGIVVASNDESLQVFFQKILA